MLTFQLKSFEKSVILVVLIVFLILVVAIVVLILVLIVLIILIVFVVIVAVAAVAVVAVVIAVVHFFTSSTVYKDSLPHLRQTIHNNKKSERKYICY